MPVWKYSAAPLPERRVHGRAAPALKHLIVAHQTLEGIFESLHVLRTTPGAPDCELSGWEPGSDEWSQFVEAPAGEDMPRLAEHLGLTVFEFSRDWNDLIGRSAHPGIAVFDFPAYQKSHTVYVHDIQWFLHHWPTPEGPPATASERPLWKRGWPLGDQYLHRGPVLGAVILDERQPSRAA